MPLRTRLNNSIAITNSSPPIEYRVEAEMTARLAGKGWTAKAIKDRRAILLGSSEISSWKYRKTPIPMQASEAPSAAYPIMNRMKYQSIFTGCRRTQNDLARQHLQ
jgi:hypothetical protein